MDNTLAVVPLLEEVSGVFLMTWVQFGQEDHLVHQLSLLETLVHQNIVFLVHGTVATLTSSLENFESSS